MESTAAPQSLAEPTPVSPRAAWRWVHVAVAALAMVATLPGRTHGLGLFTEPILRSFYLDRLDLARTLFFPTGYCDDPLVLGQQVRGINESLGKVDRESYGFLNLWATLLGGLFCLPCGWLIDRFGTRAVLTGVTVALGAVVIGMSQVQGGDGYPLTIPLPDWAGGGVFSVVLLPSLFLCILLTRGLGQSALSVASLSLIARSAGRQTGLAMGVYAFLTSAGFTLAFGVLREVVGRQPNDWRPVWAGIGLAVIAVGLLCGLLVRNRFLKADAADPDQPTAGGATESSLTLRQALRSPAFWTFSVAISFFGLISSGTALFNESILAERHFNKQVFLDVALLGIPVGLASNLLGGWLATRWPLPRLLTLAMGVLAGALLAFPHVETKAEVYVYAAALASAGGLITVCFFAVWRPGFGPAHLGQIQGAAQMLTVLFSALGPQVFASSKARLDSYLPLFPWLAAISLSLALVTWLAGLPKRK